MPYADLLLLDISERTNPARREADFEGLSRQLRQIPEFSEVEVNPRGRSMAVAKVPARNMGERDRLVALLGERLSGWRVVEESTYGLPETF